MGAWMTFFLYNALITLLLKYGIKLSFNYNIKYIGLYILSTCVTMIIAVTMYGAKKTSK
jgi:hypothetical protein